MTICYGCLKDSTECTPKSVQSEDNIMRTFATNNGLTVTQHSSGIYYQIVNPGTGPVPNANSSISVMYTGKLMDHSIFDQTSAPTALYAMSGLIQGWQIGIPLIGEGGKIHLIIPSSLAYGCQAAGAIPPNAPLYFEVDLIDVQ
jgi:FKBP-type peptidyl-prolyl cis-trans isomerase FkpA